MAKPLVDQLLEASMLCGLRPGGPAAYRLQLFAIANRDLGSKSHQSDFQRALETAVDRDELWVNAGQKGSGEYAITDEGYAQAQSRLGRVEARHRPMSKRDFACAVVGSIAGVSVVLRVSDGRTRVELDGEAISSAKEACRILSSRGAGRIETAGESAARVLYDLAVDHHFTIQLAG